MFVFYLGSQKQEECAEGMHKKEDVRTFDTSLLFRKKNVNVFNSGDAI